MGLKTTYENIVKRSDPEHELLQGGEMRQLCNAGGIQEPIRYAQEVIYIFSIGLPHPLHKGYQRYVCAATR